MLRVPETVPPSPAPPAPVAPVPVTSALMPDPILDAPVTQATPIARQPSEGWPCMGCGALVPLADNACSHCGRPFLPAEGMPSLAVPGVGDLGRMERGQRIVVSVVLALLVMGVLVAVAFIAGSLL